jgi:hypothetical protein
MQKSIIPAALLAAICLLAADTARSQTIDSLNSRPQAMRQRYSGYGNPPVSPFVNLGVNSNGISNYQTLVRPQIEERRAIEQQAAAIDQLNQRMPGGAARVERRDVERQGWGYRGAVRFMDYSHYYSVAR